MDVRRRLGEIFADVFDRDDIVITDGMSAADVEEWDSLTHVNLVVAMEHEFGIKFALGELQDLKNVGEMIALIEEKLTR